MPDFSLRFRGLAIRGYTLLVHTLEDGMRQFIVRLKRGVGNAMALFQSFGGPQSGLKILSDPADDAEGQRGNSGRLFDEMLSHLYLPLVNLNTYLRTTLDGRNNGDTDLASSVVQLKTKAEVLQFAFDRLISEMMLDKYAQNAPEGGQPNPPYLGYSREVGNDQQAV